MLTCSLQSGDKINNKNLRDENLKKIKQELNGRVDEADQCINQLHNFTFDNFEKLFFTEAVDKNNVFDVYKKYIAKLTEEGRINTASSYKCSLNSTGKEKSRGRKKNS